MKFLKAYIKFRIIATVLLIIICSSSVVTRIGDIGIINFARYVMQKEGETPLTAPAKVIKAIDGNTLLVQVVFSHDKPIKVVLQGISPINKKKAAQYINDNYTDKIVYLEKNDKGKVTGNVWIRPPLKTGQKDVANYYLNALLIKEGLSKIKGPGKYIEQINDITSNKK